MLDHQLDGCCSDCYHVAFGSYFPDTFSLEFNLMLISYFQIYFCSIIVRPFCSCGCNYTRIMKLNISDLVPIWVLHPGPCSCPNPHVLHLFPVNPAPSHVFIPVPPSLPPSRLLANIQLDQSLVFFFRARLFLSIFVLAPYFLEESIFSNFLMLFKPHGGFENASSRRPRFKQL